MKKGMIRLRPTKGVDINKPFSGSIRGGGRGYADACALEPHSNEVFPCVKTIVGFSVICKIYESNGGRQGKD